MKYVVTLVHGTWAPRASWAEDGSLLCRGLKESLPSPLVIEPFRWSGRNSFSARRKATVNLVTHLKQLLEKYPDARHFVVAHSHGGNIALHALRDSDVNRGVVGVACLATPFLIGRRRELGPFAFEHLFIMSVLVLAVFGGVGGALLAHWLPVVERLPDFVGWLLSTLGVIGLIFLVDRWAKWGRGLLQELTLPEIEAGRLLIIRTIGDEAQAALAGTQVVGWLSMRVWLPISRVAGRLAGFRGVRRMILAYPAGLLSLLAGLLLIPVAGLISVFLFAFGPGLALAGPFVDIAVEATPQGSWTVHQLPPLSGALLSHSQSYEGPRAVDLITTWMRSVGE